MDNQSQSDLPEGGIQHRVSVLLAQPSIKKLAQAFPRLHERNLFKAARPFPDLKGCFVILFTSRSGSTYLCTEVEKLYRIGAVGESFNASQLSARAKRHELSSPAAAIRYTIRNLGENQWFGFKTGNAGLAIAEMSGFMDHYQNCTKLLLLLRRDLVAQAISQVKAKISSQFHSTQAPLRRANMEDYSYADIAECLASTFDRLKILDEYITLTGRPAARIYYEDFEDGNTSVITSVCDAFGLPRRTSAAVKRTRSVEKIRDSVNSAWRERFLSAADDTVRALLNEYRQFIGEGIPAPILSRSWL